MKKVYGIVAGVSAFFALNCGSGDAAEPSAEAPAPSAESTSAETTSTPRSIVTVAVNGHTFDPPVVKVKPGTTVRWMWVAGTHNVISGSTCTPDGKFASTGLQDRGATYEHTFTEAGSFPYYCDPHCGIGMKGSVVVE